ncbi:hypothetical protein AYO44_09180 [Planctomycetaceae bacterium SCGC AG-212-F19]|nr:hypothetical protein AYO44_09180 [Planctomycetaceae bacterium SCGC AG-212-F19]
MDAYEPAFLAKIRADPLDASVRLVYADWLDDHGDSAAAARQRVCADPANDERRLALAAAFEAKGDHDRAELIRTQLPLSGLPWGDVRFYCADRRTQQLIENNRPEWDGDLPAWARKVCDEARHQSYRRGLPAVVHCDAADWLECGAELLEHHAVEEVVFTWYTLQSYLDDWLRSPLTARVKRFGLSGQYLTDTDLRKIVASPALAHVERLDLSHNSYGDDGVRALAASPNLSNLRELDLYVSGLGPQGFRAVTQSDRLPHLRRLRIGQNHCAVGDEDMRGLRESPHCYEQLILYGTAVTDAGVEGLCQAKCVASLRHLDFGGEHADRVGGGSSGGQRDTRPAGILGPDEHADRGPGGGRARALEDLESSEPPGTLARTDWPPGRPGVGPRTAPGGGRSPGPAPQYLWQHAPDRAVRKPGLSWTARLAPQCFVRHLSGRERPGEIEVAGQHPAARPWEQ